MKNKGYTLIEIIGVIVILSLIIMISVPTISGVLKSSKNKAYNIQVEEIKSASESWSLLNYDNVPKNDGDTIIINVLQLKLANLLPYDFKNPKTGELFPDDMQISITKKGNNIVYEVLTDTGTTNETLNPLAPQIILIGSINQNIEINTSYKELGASAKDKDGNGLIVTTTIANSSGNTVSSINVSTLGKYTISYSATKDSLTSTIKRVVNVVDTTAPAVTITGYTNNQYIDLESIPTYSLPTASVSDNSNALITYQIIGNFSPIIPGSKQVIYKATDESGNVGTFTLNFNVKDTIIPTATYTTTVNSTTGRKEFVVTASDSGTGLHEYAYSYDGGVTWKKENTFIYEDLNNISLKIRDKAGNIKSATPLTLLVKPNGGTWNSSTNDSSLSLEQNSTTTIANPTRAGYSFTNWTIVGTGTSISGTTLTMGSANSTITANWTANNYTLTVNANSGTWSGTTPQTIACGSTATIATPTRTNYLFSGWTVSGTGSSISGTTFTMGSANTTITANWTLNTYTLTVNANGGTWSGTTPQTIVSGSTVTINNPTKASYSFTGWTVSGAGSSISGTTFTMGNANTTITANWVVTVVSFAYTGGVQTFTVPATGNYNIEVWGAQGGGNGAYGGYSIGTKTLTQNATLYVVVGGAGSGVAGGYNGGGSTSGSGYGGGGATHIATANGILSSLSSNTTAVLIVGGGGGGVSGCCAGGTGGGTTGGNSSGTSYWTAKYATGGTQTTGGYNVTGGNAYGSFGLGSASTGANGGGGGGGWYGGGGGTWGEENSGGGGGSGYIGGVSGGSMTNGNRAGNGYATITYISS